MKNVAIIGLGWFGLELSVELMRRGYSVIGTVTSENKSMTLNQQGIHTVVMDLNNEISEEVFNAMSKADAIVITIPPNGALGTNHSIEIHSKLAHWLVQFPTPKFVYCSSTSIYTQSGIVNESMADMETLAFKLEKIYEKQLKNLAILRFGGLIGKNRHPIHGLMNKKNIEMPNAVVNLTHLNDAIEAAMFVLINEVEGDFNAVNKNHPTRKEYYNLIANGLNFPTLHFEFDDLREGKIVSSEKLTSLINGPFLNANLYLQ